MPQSEIGGQYTYLSTGRTDIPVCQTQKIFWLSAFGFGLEPIAKSLKPEKLNKGLGISADVLLQESIVSESEERKIERKKDAIARYEVSG